MSWGCKQKPNGCGWANWQTYPGGLRQWWCDVCERSGTYQTPAGGGGAAPGTQSTPTTPTDRCTCGRLWNECKTSMPETSTASEHPQPCPSPSVTSRFTGIPRRPADRGSYRKDSAEL